MAKIKSYLSEKLANDASPRLTITVKLSISTHKPEKIHIIGEGFFFQFEIIINVLVSSFCFI